MAAKGSAVFSVQESDDGHWLALTWVCTADGSGDLDSPTTTQPDNTGVYKYNTQYTGFLAEVRIKPGTGDDLPTDAYDVQLNSKDDAGIDFLATLGQNCPQATTKMAIPQTILFNDYLVPFAAACGAGNKFTMTIYIYKKAYSFMA